MKVLFRNRKRNKNKKILKCRKCGTVFLARLSECDAGMNIVRDINWYADCPTCGFSVFYGPQLYDDE